MLTTLTVRGVREAYPLGLALLAEHGVREETRNGPAIVLPGPMVTTYTRSWERVLLDPRRDANPFFHLMEAFWMLAGRRDVASLMRYNAGMAKYSDDGVTFHGAYGARWRSHFIQTRELNTEIGVAPGHRAGRSLEIDVMDQIVAAVEELRRDPSSRRVVISMWDPSADLGRNGLDLPCNTQIYLRLRSENGHLRGLREEVMVGPGQTIDVTNTRGALVARQVLDLTLMCRSNDAIWGAYGANAVHFSVLHEFLAALLGARVGELHQLSNNFHAYLEQMERVGQPWEAGGLHDEYGATIPLFGDLVNVDPRAALADIEQLWDDDPDGEVDHLPVETIRLVAGMRLAWQGWKDRQWDAAEAGVAMIPHPDWRRACMEWLERRRDKFS